MKIPRFLREAMSARRSVRTVIRRPWLAACLLAGAAALLAAAPVSAQILDPRTLQQDSVNTSDPSEMFLKAYTSVQQAEKLEQEGRRGQALAKYRFAASLLEQLTQTNPNWQPLIVRYRLRSTSDTIRQLEEKAGLQAATPAPGAASLPGASATEDDLPAPDNVGPAGSTSLTPAPAPAASNEALDRTITDLRSKNAKIQKELKAALDSLASAQEEKKKLLATSQKEKKEAADSAHKDKQDALAAANKDKQDALAASAKEKEDALTKAEKDKGALVKERDNMEFQAQSSRSEATTAQKRFERTKADRDQLQGQLTKTEDRLKEVSDKTPGAVQSRKELRDQVADLKKQLARAQTDTDSAGRTRAEVDARFAADEKRIGELTRERDTATQQVDQGRDAVRKLQELQAQNASLTGENTALNDKLAAAEKRIAQVTEESIKKKEELNGMQQELSGLRDQLVASRDQNDRSATTITELRQQLDDGAKKLEEMKAKGATGEDFARMTNENEILRGVVVRQLKEQARTAAVRKLLAAELERLDVQSTTLNAQIAELGRPTTQLSDEERALFKEPQITRADQDSSATMEVTIAKVGNGRQTDAAQTTPNPAPVEDPSAAGRTAPPETAADDHASKGAPDGKGGSPKVVTSPQPLVSEELRPMAKEAQENFSRGKYTEAERVYSQLLARDPKNPYLLANQGVVLLRQDKLKSAEVVLRKALAVAPKDPYCVATLGIVYYRMHRYDDALTYLTQAIQLDPKNATAHNYLGITSSQKGWPEAALVEIQKAITINPNYADAHFNIAVIYATNQPPSKEQAQLHYKIATSLGATPDPTLEKMIQN